MGFETQFKFDPSPVVTNTDTQPTREFFRIFPEATKSIIDYAVFYLNVDERITALTEHIPWNFGSLVSVSLVWISWWTGAYSFTVDTDYASNGEAFNNHSSTANFALGGVNSIINETDLTPLFANLTANDYFGVKVTHTGGVPDEMWLIGVRVRYSAALPM